jgi:hypothetical protein
MDKDHIFLIMEINMSDSLKMMNSMDKEHNLIKILYMKENLKTLILMVTELLLLQMDINIKVN